MFHRYLTEHFVSFCDNSAATSALRKGYGSDPSVNILISLFAAVTAITAKWPYMEFVASEANISDGVSRQDMSLPRKLGWNDRSLPSAVWDILTSAADLSPNAVEAAAYALIEASTT